MSRLNDGVSKRGLIEMEEISVRLESIIARLGSTLDDIDAGNISHEDGMQVLRLSIDSIEGLHNYVEHKIEPLDYDDLPFTQVTEY